MSSQAQDRFATMILDDLLRHIAVENVKNTKYPRAGARVYEVSHAWTIGPVFHLVYTTPPSQRIWGLARDTRSSLISPGPWSDTDDPGLYYYLLDLEEGWWGGGSGGLLEGPDLIRWRGDLTDGEPPRRSGLLSEAHRHTPPALSPAETDPAPPPPPGEPRRYADPRGLRNP